MKFGGTGLVRCLMASAFALALPAAAPADEASDLMLRHEFEERMAKQMVENCPAFEIDRNAVRVRNLKLDLKLSQMGSSLSALSVRRPASDFDGLNQAFAVRHGFGQATTVGDFCAVADREHAEETPIGSMLKQVE